MLALANASKSFGWKDLLLNVNITFLDHKVHAIVGENGCGKTTLLRLIAGIESLDSGAISMTAPKQMITYGKQELDIISNMSVEAFLKQEISILSLEKAMKECEDFLDVPEKLEEYGNILSHYESLGGYDFENQIHEIFTGLGILNIAMDLNMAELSSGQRSKISLAANLFKKSDILLLDEPTNNLDREWILWLTNAIVRLWKTVYIVSHDREFLDRVSDTTYEIDPRSKSITLYPGNYSAYEKFKAAEFARKTAEYEQQQEEIGHLISTIKDTRIWAEKWGNLKQGKDIDSKTVKFFRNRSTAKLGGKTQALEKRLARIDELEKPKEKKKIRYSVEDIEGAGYIHFEEMIYRYPGHGFALHIPEIRFEKTDRIGIFGKNGSGKSTFLKILTESSTPEGKNPYISPSLKMANFMQEHENLPREKTGLEIIASLGMYSEIESHKILSTFGLSKEERNTPVKTLSPGQRAKLLLSLFRARESNVLVLDEPTNHLDMEAILVLEKAIYDFKWMIIVVSHDVRFIEQIGISRVFEIENGEMREN